MLIGHAKSLVGVLALPEDEVRARSPAIVILNTGIVHRVGHHRMYVTMARRLARAGHAVLRFDLSGLGDSRRRANGSNPHADAHEDTREAVDWLAGKFGFKDVLVMGLCSGSDVALRYGHTDPRVVGLVLLDPEVPPTARFYTNYIRERISRLPSWLTFARGRGRIWGDVASMVATVATRGAIESTSRAELEHHYRCSIAQGIHLFVALTGGDLAWRQTYREQLLDAFPSVPFADRLRLEYFPKSDHTLTPAEDRARLNDMLEEWLRTTSFRQGSLEPPHERQLA
ncbi:MAG: alpha/beta fold hydrolase [Hyphomicrobiaceae bacterium]